MSKNKELLDEILVILRGVAQTLGEAPMIEPRDYAEDSAHDVIYVAGFWTALTAVLVDLIAFLESPDGIHPKGHPNLN